MRLEGSSIMPDSIFGVLDNGNRGRVFLFGGFGLYARGDVCSEPTSRSALVTRDFRAPMR